VPFAGLTERTCRFEESEFFNAVVFDRLLLWLLHGISRLTFNLKKRFNAKSMIFSGSACVDLSQ